MDHIIRRAFALSRLCWHDVMNASDLINEKLKSVFGENWETDYEKRNHEKVRME